MGSWLFTAYHAATFIELVSIGSATCLGRYAISLLIRTFHDLLVSDKNPSMATITVSWVLGDSARAFLSIVEKFLSPPAWSMIASIAARPISRFLFCSRATLSAVLRSSSRSAINSSSHALRIAADKSLTEMLTRSMNLEGLGSSIINTGFGNG